MHEHSECLRHPGLQASITNTPTALNSIAQGKHARARRMPAPPWVMCVQQNRDERELFHPNTLCRVATESRFALARTERAIEYGRWPNAHVGDVILGRRRVATWPQAMLNMAFGQMKYANGVKQHSPG